MISKNYLKIKNLVIFFINLIKNFNKYFYNFILSRKFFIKKNNKKILTLRKLGGHVGFRAETFFSKEPETLSWIENFNNFENKITFFDIGANIGLYSLYSCYRHSNIITYSFEPESLNFAALNLNIFDNSYSNKIKAFPISVSENQVDVDYLNLKKLRFGGSSNSFKRKINSEGNIAKNVYEQGSVSLSIDNFCEIMSVKPNYIKIDVDGNELLVIKSMKKILQDQSLKSILIELNTKFNEHKEIIKILKLNNFRIEVFGNKDITSNYIFTKIT